MTVRIALDVPPLRRSRYGEALLKRAPDYLCAEGAAKLSAEAAAAWANVLQPAPQIDIEVINIGLVMSGNKFSAGVKNMHLPRVRAPNGVPEGYRGRTITL